MEHRLVDNDAGDLSQQGLEANRRACCVDRGGLGLTSELGNVADHCRLDTVAIDQYEQIG